MQQGQITAGEYYQVTNKGYKRLENQLVQVSDHPNYL